MISADNLSDGLVDVLKVKLLHPDAKAPTVSHAGSDLGYDLYSVENIVLQPGLPVKVRTGVAIEGPPGVGFILGDRSSMAARGVTYAGGRIDAGYRGEILICLINVNQPIYTLDEEKDSDGRLTHVELRCTDVTVTIRKGDRIIQLSPFRSLTSARIVIVEELSVTARNDKGFGSSGL